MGRGPEYEQVERPFFTQLRSMGWLHTEGNEYDPTVTHRETFREVLILDDLRDALRRINLDPDGNEWLDAGRITQAVSAIQRIGVAKLLEANEKATELLRKGTVVDGVEGWERGRARTVHFIDWETPGNNTFRMINQFRVDEPGGQAKKYIVPDLVLFVNGIPLVVVECKAPEVTEPMTEAIDQLQRYSNQRDWVPQNEGSEKLFHTNQFVVATCYDEARVGTFTSEAVHYLEWKDTSPVPMAEVAAALGKDSLSSQEKLVAGMLRPEILLDIVRHCVLFMQNTGTRIKIICRYQQYRALQHCIERLLRGKTRLEHGEFDQRGGIVWHTQGSGKSVTMAFLIRKMRSIPKLRGFKIVVVTDRRALEKQLAETATLTDESLSIIRPEQRGPVSVPSVQVLKDTLSRPGKDLVFVLIQKYHDETGSFPVLNKDESILVLVDEAHRSHTNTAHANMRMALPNCARIGFTGTPIIMGAKKRTHEIFGDFIDRYTIGESEDDGSTVPIIYEGLATKSAVSEVADLDEEFPDLFPDFTPEELEKIKAKYATKGHVMEAPALIKAKARSMLRHYVQNILPNGFKAQVVTVSRRAAVRYYDALGDAQAELIEQLESIDPALLELDDEDRDKLPKKKAFLVHAHRYLETIRGLEFAPVISGSHNDDPAWSEWTNEVKRDARVERFKRPLFHDDPAKRDPLAFLIVKSMLLTGFDAPIEQVMYLDRHMKEAELLQAIARVNRTYGEKKTAGLVVDYYGNAQHLKEALEAYSPEDIEGALRSLKDEIPKLRDRQARALDVLQSRGIEDIGRLEECVELLRDERVRAEFKVVLKQFLATLDLVLPRPEALPYVPTARALTEIQVRASKRYRGDERPLGREVGEKVRKLIDDHVISLGIDPKISPLAITDATFGGHVEAQESPRAKASEMEHALRYHIRKKFDEDPEYYEKLSERLESILEALADKWDQLVIALEDLVQEAKEGREADETGLDPETQIPFLGVLRQEVSGDGELTDETLGRLCGITIELVEHIQNEVRLVGFWTNAVARDHLRKWIVEHLDSAGDGLIPFERLSGVASKLLELARANHYRLVA